MLELRPNCENCNKLLSADSSDARVCSYECTFCSDCVNNVLKDICPNCGGNFVSRPIRPAECLIKDPASTTVVFKPIRR